MEVIRIEKIEFYQIIEKVGNSEIVYRRYANGGPWLRIFEDGFEVGVDNKGLECALQEHLSRLK